MNLLNLFNRQSIKEVTGIDINISQEMYDAITLCNAVMTHSAPWNDKAHSCGIPDQLASMLSETVMQEIGIEVTNEAIRRPLEKLNANISKIVQYISLLGGGLLRPIFANGKLQYEIIPLGNYLPTAYDFDGTLLSALVMKSIQDGTKKFLLCEKHEYKYGAHTVESALYRNDGGSLYRTTLSACSQTADITESYAWQGVRQPMIVEFRSHVLNKIDGSDVPQALIYGAIDLIRDADEQYHRMNTEQANGEKIIFADRDLFVKRQNKDGDTVQTRLTPKLKNLIIGIDGDGSTDGTKIKEYSPDLRTAQQAEFLQQVFRRIEMTLNIGKGSISDIEGVQQTATQYTGGRKSFYSIVDTIEDEIETKYHQCAEVLAHMAAAYRIGSNDADIKVIWNDGLRKDPVTEKQIAMQEVAAGLMTAVEYRMKFYGEDEAAARRAAEELRQARGAFVL